MVYSCTFVTQIPVARVLSHKNTWIACLLKSQPHLANLSLLALFIATQHMHFNPSRMKLLNLSPTTITTQNNNYDYLIGGDYNINLIKCQENSNVSNYVDCLASCGCISLINKPTRFRKNSKPSLLDHIYINLCDEKRIINSRITIFDISDHLPIFVNFNLYHQNSKPKFRCMKHFDPTIFVSDLSLKLNNLNPEADDVNTLSDEFVKNFNDTLDTHAPYRYASRK